MMINNDHSRQWRTRGGPTLRNAAPPPQLKSWIRQFKPGILRRTFGVKTWRKLRKPTLSEK